VARISGASSKQGGLFRRLYVGIVYSLTKRRLGRTIMPIQVAAHHTAIFWGYTQMEQSHANAKLIDAKLKGLAELRVATLIGCPF
jgi:hypothetical protein